MDLKGILTSCSWVLSFACCQRQKAADISAVVSSRQAVWDIFASSTLHEWKLDLDTNYSIQVFVKTKPKKNTFIQTYCFSQLTCTMSHPSFFQHFFKQTLRPPCLHPVQRHQESSPLTRHSRLLPWLVVVMAMDGWMVGEGWCGK